MANSYPSARIISCSESMQADSARVGSKDKNLLLTGEVIIINNSDQVNRALSVGLGAGQRAFPAVFHFILTIDYDSVMEMKKGSLHP